MSEFTTSTGRDVSHCHIIPDNPCGLEILTPEIIRAARERVHREFPRARVVRDATRAYNCYGFALAHSHATFLSGQEILADDFGQVALGQPRVGDVAAYHNFIGTDDELLTHVAIVRRVVAGRITLLQSKWGGNPEVLHSPGDVPVDYGRIAELFRRTDGAPMDAFLNLDELSEEIMSEATIREAIEGFSDPDVHIRLLDASTPEVRSMIIRSLPGVRELTEAGPEARPAVLEFFQKDETQSSDGLTGIALYLLQRLPYEEAAQPLARYVRSGNVSEMNRKLAAQAFLTTTGTEVDDEDPESVAFRESERYL